MDRISEYFEIRHKSSGGFIEVHPQRPEYRKTERAFRVGTRVCLRQRSNEAPERLPDATSLWRYEHGKFVSQGGAQDFLVLTAVFIEQRAPVDAGPGRYGHWELMLYNQEGTANLTAHQYWVINADGTIRLKEEENVCLAVASRTQDDDEAFLLTTAVYQEDKHERFTWFVGHYALPSVSLHDRYIGCLLGLITGDSLGSPFEGWTAQEIAIMYPHGVHALADRHDIQSTHPSDKSTTTDTSATPAVHRAGHLTCRSTFALALATSLAEMRRIDDAHIRQRSAELFAVRAHAGATSLFPVAAKAELEDLLADRPSRTSWPPLSPTAAGLAAHTGASHDGAAACSRAPALSLAFALPPAGGGQPESESDSDGPLTDGVRQALAGSDSDLNGAYMVAKAVQLLLRAGGPASFDPAAFLTDLAAAMDDAAGRPALRSAPGGPSRNSHSPGGAAVLPAGGRTATPPPAWCAATPRTLSVLLPAAADGRLGAAALAGLESRHGLRHGACVPFPGRSADSVPAALWAFVLLWRTPRRCLARAVAAGGDCATVGAVTGALLGALHGPGWVDRRWFDQLDNGLHGRDYAVRVAGLMADVFASPQPQARS